MCLLLEIPSNKKLDPIYEMTMKQLMTAVKDTDPQRVAKAKPLKSYYLGLNKYGDLMFKTTSGTTPGHYWYQTVRLVDLPKAIELFSREQKITNRDIVSLAVFGDLKLYCNDLSFRYMGWQYMAWNMGYGIVPEERYPSKRNPKLKGAICKHLYNVLSVLPFHTNVIVKDLRRKVFRDPSINIKNR